MGRVSQALTTVSAMGQAVQAVETLAPASKVHSGLAGVARLHSKSRQDPDTLIGATEWRIRAQTDLTSSHRANKWEALEVARRDKCRIVGSICAHSR